MDVDAEDDDFVVSLDSPSPADPSLTLGASGDALAPEDEDEWDTESELSDTSTDALDGEDEDDVVPRSFTFFTSASSQPDDDHSMSDGNLPEPPLQPEEEQPPSPLKVYGSNSKHSNSLSALWRADLNGFRALLRSTPQ
jgi:hypothetical protein